MILCKKISDSLQLLVQYLIPAVFVITLAITFAPDSQAVIFLTDKPLSACELPLVLHNEIAKHENELADKFKNKIKNKNLISKTLKKSDYYPETGITACQEVSGLPGVFLCISQEIETMNSIFTRLSLFLEGSNDTKKGQIFSMNDPIYLSKLETIAGHDLPVSGIFDFYNKVQKKCEVDPLYCLNEHEKEFFETLFFTAAHNGAQVFIAATPKSHVDFKAIIDHEIAHAQYFTQKKYRAAIHEFWNQKLNSKEKEEIKSQLVLYGNYDISTEELVINEFQAFALTRFQSESQSQFQFISHHYHAPLVRWLKEHRTAPHALFPYLRND